MGIHISACLQCPCSAQSTAGKPCACTLKRLHRSQLNTYYRPASCPHSKLLCLLSRTACSLCVTHSSLMSDVSGEAREQSSRSKSRGLYTFCDEDKLFDYSGCLKLTINKSRGNFCWNEGNTALCRNGQITLSKPGALKGKSSLGDILSCIQLGSI